MFFAVFNISKSMLWLYPSVILVPLYGSRNALFQFPLWLVAEILYGRFYVALPVALTKYVILVVVKRVHLASDVTNACAAPADDTQQPQRGFYVQYPGIAQMLLDEVAVAAAVIDLSVA